MDTSWNRKKAAAEYHKWKKPTKKDKKQDDQHNGPPPPTLVKYKGSVMVGDSSYLLKNGKIPIPKPGRGEELKLDSVHMDPPPNYRGVPRCKNSGDTKYQLEELFHKLIPPRQWIMDGMLWRQSIATAPAPTREVVHLGNELKARLKARGATPTGICPIRRDLYSQCLDEILRQVTINCTERGLILRQIRDEGNHSLESYKKLYCSAVAYALKKRLMARTKKLEMNEAYEQACFEKAKEEDRLHALRQRYEEMAVHFDHELNLEQTRNFEEAEHLRRQNEALRMRLEATINPISPAQRRAAEEAEKKAKAEPRDVFRSKEDITTSFEDITVTETKEVKTSSSEVENLKEFLKQSRRLSKESETLDFPGRKLSKSTEPPHEEKSEGEDGEEEIIKAAHADDSTEEE